MLVNHTFLPSRLRPMRRQNGVVMLVALIVLVLMTLAGIALMRSMDTTNLIAGNMAFKQSATHAADLGIEEAVSWLEQNNALAGGAGLDSNIPSAGYTSDTGNNASAGVGETFWRNQSANGVCYLPVLGGACSAAPGVANAAGHTVGFMIQRLCALSSVGRLNAKCALVPGAVNAGGGSQGAGNPSLSGASNAVYYRITVRVQGPRNSVSYVQAIVYM